MLNPDTFFKYWTIKYRGPVLCNNALGEFLYNLFMCHTSVEVKRAYI